VGHGIGHDERHHCDIPQYRVVPAVVVTGRAGGPFYAIPTATSVTITSTTGTQTVSWQLTIGAGLRAEGEPARVCSSALVGRDN
jgi:hypothetical protein